MQIQVNRLFFYVYLTEKNLISIFVCLCVGRFSATSSFDYEQVLGGEYPVQVQASTSPQQVATAGITVRVTDDKDPPTFSRSSYTFDIDENTPGGTTILPKNADGSSGGLLISDEDTAITQFDCTIENVPGNVFDHFRVVNPDNSVKECKLVTVRGFNFVENPSFQFEVRATDRNYRNMFASAQVKVVIKDTNDHSPEFSQASYWASVGRDYPAGNSILKVIATDQDSGSFGEITYELLNTQDRSRYLCHLLILFPFLINIVVFSIIPLSDQYCSHV